MGTKPIFLTNKDIVKNVDHFRVKDDLISEALSSLRMLDARRLNWRGMSHNGEVNYVFSIIFLITFEGRRNQMNFFSMHTLPTWRVTSVLFSIVWSVWDSVTLLGSAGAKEQTIKVCLNNIKCVYYHGDMLTTNKECKELNR